MKKKCPLNYIVVIQRYSSNHLAIGLEWKDNPNMEKFSYGDGYVEDIHNSKDGGNVVKLNTKMEHHHF